MSTDLILRPLSEGIIHLWIIDLDVWRGNSRQLRSLLSRSEMTRLDRLKVKAKREEFLCSRGVLRLILSMYSGQDPLNLPLYISPWGKPSLPGSGIEFSLSHSGNLLVYGFGAKARIGIDIQEIYPITHLERVVNRFFTFAEIDYLGSIPDAEEYKTNFFALWTAKEAVLKAVGKGIRRSFKQVSVLPKSCDLEEFQLDPPGFDAELFRGEILALDLAQGYRGAIASSGPVREMIRIEVQPGDFQYLKDAQKAVQPLPDYS